MVNAKKQKMTLVEKTLKEILIPKDDPTDDSRFKQLLVWNGAILMGDENWDSIIINQGVKGSGKTTVYNIEKELFKYANIPCLCIDDGDLSKLPSSYDGIKAILIDDFNMEDMAYFSKIAPKLPMLLFIKS